ncbi:hypothetical protein TNCV_2637091 [Trichonephila clavipes]|uniref:Mos1 transposase HTH domain-containing protein n=1 Tax=Trichonephila clavipes TaxID=2585209 RepID=A0A8X6R7V2_TRICX|nr:hypothetical protein TNCV_2637091 [Trichonephila clavipes]
MQRHVIEDQLEACGENVVPYRMAARWIKAFPSGGHETADKSVNRRGLPPQRKVRQEFSWMGAYPPVGETLPFDNVLLPIVTVEHPLFSPDMSLKLKEPLRQFHDVSSALPVADICNQHLDNGLSDFWKKVISFPGDYVEKIECNCTFPFPELDIPVTILPPTCGIYSPSGNNIEQRLPYFNDSPSNPNGLITRLSSPRKHSLFVSFCSYLPIHSYL